MLNWIKKLLNRKSKPQRTDLIFVNYADADKLIRSTNGAWKIAPEEDSNHVIGMVWLERFEGERANCQINGLSSRVCEKGTMGCIVYHTLDEATKL